MPLLSPKQIYDALSEVPKGSATSNAKSPKDSLADLLAKNNLTPDEVLEQVRTNMVCAEQAPTRLRAAEIALKLNGLLDEAKGNQNFVVNITIMDSEFSQVNPILIPR